MTKSLAIFGATGSIGTSTLDLVRRQPEVYRASILTAHSNVALMKSLAEEFHPDLIVMSEESAAVNLQRELPKFSILAGEEGLVAAANQPYDLMIAAIVGFAGLAATFAAISAGRDVALANKESLVCAGGIVMGKARETGSLILPVDSEHNAIFQCWEDRNREQISKVQLTASGGPFRGWSAEQVACAGLEQALNHPNWSMGPKVTIDSATLMNKALEMIEARWLFELRPEQIEIVVHPQSIVHSCVSYTDGSTLAQLSQPDMCTPIAYCLAYPDRATQGGKPLSLTDLEKLTFEKPDEGVFPALGLARAAMATDTSASTLALNAVNEVLNSAVRAGRLPFGQLMPCLCRMMELLDVPKAQDLAALTALDFQIRVQTREKIDAWAG